MTESAATTILLTGATGFVGSALYPALVEAGYDVRCATRRPEEAADAHPEREWVEFDLERPDTMASALEGCDRAFYLVHRMKSGEGYHERERISARTFAEAAVEADLDRVVYLGGVAPEGPASEHLESRLETGRILRREGVSTIELRAAMILGPGSDSWKIVRDLAARLPFMVLPSWTSSRSQPVHIDDVVEALLGALELPGDASAWYDIPGPEVLSVEDIMVRVARQMGHEPRRLRVALVTPKLSSYWLRFVTRCDYYLARQLVQGLKHDLLARSDEFWEMIGHTELVPFDEAVRRTLATDTDVSFPAQLYESGVHRIARCLR
jgi:uncharacterized protein YbjT (DUF2867 family)